MKTAWTLDKNHKKYLPLKSDYVADVAIVGGGLAGLLTAYTLLKAGKKVVVLEADTCGGVNGTTNYTTGFLTQIIDTGYTELIDMYGAKQAKQVWDSHGKAIDLIEKIVQDEKIDCEFTRCTHYILSNSEDEFNDLKPEYDTIKKFGGAVSLNGTGTVKRNGLDFENTGFIALKNQGKFHALKFIEGLLRCISAYGGEIFEKTKVDTITSKKNMAVVKAGNYVIKAEYAITATYDPLNNPIQTFAKKGMYVSYVYELSVPHGKYKEATYEDSKNPYHYVRVDVQQGENNNTDRLIVGGEDHRKELPVSAQKNFKALKHYIDEDLKITEYQIVRKWSGEILEPSDGLPLIGEFKNRQLVATAFSGNGMTYSAVSALLFRDILTKKKNSWTKLYDPTRIPTIKQLYQKGKDYIGEFIGGAAKNTIKYRGGRA